MPRDPGRDFARDGVAVFGPDAAMARWAAAAWATAHPLVESAATRAGGLRCGGTWFTGVDLLPNAADGSVAGVPFAGPACAALEELELAPASWHRAQVSVTYPGYPRPMEGESAGAARYRLRRDAAHVDGLLPVGAERRRHLQEPHAFILGVALTDNDAEASPLVVWPGSHRVLGRAFAGARAVRPAHAAEDIDLTETYTSARRAVFESCSRTPLRLRPGQAVLMHRHTLHGIAPWTARADAQGRAMAYFRPEVNDPEVWFRAW